MEEKWYDKSKSKAILLALTPIVIGVLSAFIELDSDKVVQSVVFGVLTVVVCVIYVFLIVHYTKLDLNKKVAEQIIQKENEAFVNIMTNATSIYMNTAEGLNNISHGVVSNNSVDMNLWCFDKTSMLICQAAYKILKALRNDSEFEVTYVKLIEDGPNKGKVETVGFENESQTHPSVLHVPREVPKSLTHPGAYYDTKLFNKDSSEIVTFADSQDLFDAFEFKDRTSQNSKKYSQYFGIPVFCNNNKMIGLLQVVSLSGTKIGNDKKQLETIAKRYLKTLCELSVIMSKIEKLLMSLPNLSVKGRI